MIIDEETGEILDDAQGYGFKSTRKAYAAWAYKTRDKSKDKERAEREKEIKKWLKENKDFRTDIEISAFEIMKGSGDPNDKFDANLIKKLLKEHNLDPEFTAGEILKVWKKS